MSEPLSCAEARDVAAEVALGIADARDRARLVTHIGTCASCRRLLMELSETVDDIVVLAPERQPPAGFESRVLARLHGEPSRRARLRLGGVLGGARRLPAVRQVALRAAALAVVAAIAGGAVYWADKPERELADNVRRTLATANGQYFTAFPLLDTTGATSGSLFAYQGRPAWMFLTVQPAVPPGRYAVEITDRHGVSYVLASGLDLAGTPSWGGTIPVAVHDVAVLRVVADGDRLAYSASPGTR